MKFNLIEKFQNYKPGINRDAISFGIFMDGLNIKIAQLSKVDNKIIIQSLDEIDLQFPLYPDSDVVLDGSSDIDTVNIKSSTHFDGESFNLPDLTDINASQGMPDINNQIPESGLDELSNILSKYVLESGKVSLNGNDNYVSFIELPDNIETAKVKSYIKKEIIKKDKEKYKNAQFDYFINPDGSTFAYIQEQPSKLLKAVREISKEKAEDKVFFEAILPNELALVELFRNNYNFSENEYSTIVYIGSEYKVGIIMKGNNFIRSFPFVYEERFPERIRQVIYSKLMLEQDTLQLPIMKNIILAGNLSGEDDISSLLEKCGGDCHIQAISIQQAHLNKKMSVAGSSDLLSKYAIAISLALQSFRKSENKSIMGNLLPSKIIDEQKYFKLAWHGIIAILIIFYVSFETTSKHFNLNTSVSRQRYLNSVLESEISKDKSKIAEMNAIIKRKDKLEADLEIINSVTGSKNQWSYLLQLLSENYKKNSYSWISGLSSDPLRFTISGITTKRENVIHLSKVFPESRIMAVTYDEIESVPVWNFNMNFSYYSRKDFKRLTTPPNPTPEEFSNKILKSFASKEYSTVIKKYERFKSLYPENDKGNELLYCSARSHFYKKNYTRAKEQFNTLYYSDRGETNNYLNFLIQIYDSLNNNKLRDSLKKDYIQLFPEDIKTEKYIKEIYPEKISKKIDKKSIVPIKTEISFEQKKKIKRPDVSNSESFYNRTLNKYLERNYIGAQADAEQFLTKNPDDAFYYPMKYLYGEILYQQQYYQKAVSIFEDVLRMNGNKRPDALIMIGYSYAKIQLFSQALWAWKKLELNYPDYQSEKVQALIKKFSTRNPVEQRTIDTSALFVGNSGFKWVDMTSDYNSIVDIFLDGNYNEAILYSNEYNKKYSSIRYQNKITFLKGECYYHLKSYQQASEIFSYLADNSKYHKFESLFMLAKVYHKSGDIEHSKVILDSLKIKYPNHQLSRKVKEYYDTL